MNPVASRQTKTSELAAGPLHTFSVRFYCTTLHKTEKKQGFPELVQQHENKDSVQQTEAAVSFRRKTQIYKLNESASGAYFSNVALSM